MESLYGLSHHYIVDTLPKFFIPQLTDHPKLPSTLKKLAPDLASKS